MSTDPAKVDLSKLTREAEGGGEGVLLDAFVGSVGWKAVKAVAGGAAGADRGQLQRAWTELERSEQAVIARYADADAAEAGNRTGEEDRPPGSPGLRKVAGEEKLDRDRITQEGAGRGRNDGPNADALRLLLRMANATSMLNRSEAGGEGNTTQESEMDAASEVQEWMRVSSALEGATDSMALGNANSAGRGARWPGDKGVAESEAREVSQNTLEQLESERFYSKSEVASDLPGNASVRFKFEGDDTPRKARRSRGEAGDDDAALSQVFFALIFSPPYPLSLIFSRAAPASPSC